MTAVKTSLQWPSHCLMTSYVCISYSMHSGKEIYTNLDDALHIVGHVYIMLQGYLYCPTRVNLFFSQGSHKNRMQKDNINTASTQ